MDAQFVEREYNNRAMVPEHPAIFARWEKDSQFVRASLRGHVDIAYGSDARHRIDIFPAENARGLLVFIHGGYWRSLDKSMFSWLAASWVAAGVSVAAPNYRLAPSVAIDAIVDDAIAAMNFLVRKGPSYGVSSDRIVVSGHSAGGHLAAALLAAPLSRLQFDAARIIGAVPISGVFDFEPLLLHAFNADFKLTPESARALSLHDKKPTVAAPLVIAAGVNVAMPNYRLVPNVLIEDIVSDALAATNWLFSAGPTRGFAMERVVLSGHSAGGHLAAAIFAAPRDAMQFEPSRIAGGVPISGIFDFEPLLAHSFNADFRLDPGQAKRLDLHDKPSTIRAPLVVAAGGAESSEFRRQSRCLADAWGTQVKALMLLPSLNHFSVVDAFAERGQPLYESALGLFA